MQNSLEKRILKGARMAHSDYSAMTGGWWLWHAPESFIQMAVAREIAKDGCTVYVDASTKRIMSEIQRGRGRPPKHSSQRADISVWHKTTHRHQDWSLRAIIEIKRAWNFLTVSGDAQKVRKHLGSKKGSKCGYLLVYSEARGWGSRDRMDMLRARFDDWAKRLGWNLVGQCTGTKGDENWAWGFCLLRCPKI